MYIYLHFEKHLVFPNLAFSLEVGLPHSQKDLCPLRPWQHLTITNGQPRDTGNIGKSRMDNPETLATLGNHEWTTQRHWQHRAGRWFSPGTPVSSTNKTDRHDITQILLKVAFKHHNPNPLYIMNYPLVFPWNKYPLFNSKLMPCFTTLCHHSFHNIRIFINIIYTDNIVTCFSNPQFPARIKTNRSRFT